MKPILVMSLGTRATRWRNAGTAELWSLSVLRLRALVDVGQFSEFVLFTDDQGAGWARALELPFTGLELQKWGSLAGVPATAWAAPKLATYAAMDRPFLHVDGDILIKRALPAWFLSAPVACELAESWCPCDGTFKAWVLPAEWQKALDGCAKLSWGCGLLGGQEWAMIAASATKGLWVLRANADKATPAGTQDSILCEQWGLAREVDPWGVATLLPQGAVRSEVAGAHYRHLGAGLKFTPEWQRKVARSLSEEWPGQVDRCAEVMRAFSAP